MGKFSFNKDYAKRTSMHRDPEQHKKRGENLIARKKQIFAKNKAQEETKQNTAEAATEEIRMTPPAATVINDREIGEKLQQLTAAFRATNGQEEENALRAFAAEHHMNLRVEAAVSKTDKSIIARMVFNGGVEKPFGGYSSLFADLANYPYKYAAIPGKAEDYDLSGSTLWQAMKEEPRLAELEEKMKEALAKAGVPKEILPEMNINDFKYLMFNHCAAQKGLGFAKLFQAKDENGNPLTRKDRNGKDTPVCTSAKQENIKRFISENPQFKDMMMKMPGADKNYVDTLVQKMANEGLTDMTKELEKHPEWANQPAIDVHHVINIKDCRLFETEGKSYADVNGYDNMCFVSNGTLFDAVNRACGQYYNNDKTASVHGSIHSADMVFKNRGSEGEVKRTMVRLEPQLGVRCMLGFGKEMIIVDNRGQQQQKANERTPQTANMFQQYNTGARSA